MKFGILFLILISSIYRPIAYSQTLTSLYEAKEYFALQRVLKKDYSKLPLLKKSYYKAIIYNKFNQLDSSVIEIKKLKKLFNRYTVKERYELLKIQADNYFKLFRYDKAYFETSELLKTYGSLISRKEAEDLKNNQIVYKSLREIPPQKVVVHESTIPFTKNLLGLRMVPVLLQGGSSEEFIFDSGANISTIIESLAVKNGFKIFNESVSVGTITSQKVKAKIGVAPVLKVGAVGFKNVVFLVLPDSVLNINQLNFQVKGIIGYPVISALGNLNISYSGNYIKIASKQFTGNTDRNLCLDELTPIISLTNGTDSLSFSFDTGANTSMLYLPYYNRYKTTFDSKYNITTCTVTGGGGQQKLPCMIIDSLKLSADGVSGIIKNVRLILEKTNEESTKFYGNIGQDFISTFKEIQIDFINMIVSFK
jgi:tetratricopeptide (TPR) repeat protein